MLSATLLPGQQVTVRGIAYDSLRHAPLSGALIAIGGTYASLWDAFTGGQQVHRSSLASAG